MTTTNENQNERHARPRGIFGLLVEMRDQGLIKTMPGGWAKVLFVLLSHRNEQGFAWPSQETLAKEAGVDERTVRRCVRWAKVALGVIVKRGHYNIYYVPFDQKVERWDAAIPAREKSKQGGARIGQQNTPKEMKA